MTAVISALAIYAAVTFLVLALVAVLSRANDSVDRRGTVRRHRPKRFEPYLQR